MINVRMASAFVMAVKITFVVMIVVGIAHPLAAEPLKLEWKWSNVVIGGQEGPRDAYGRYWKEQNFDDSRWSNISLPFHAKEGGVNDRYFRTHFTWDGQSDIQIELASDDGIDIYINGKQFAIYGNGWHQPGCVNNPGGVCAISEEVTSYVLSGAPDISNIKKGDNVIAVNLWNAACCDAYLDINLTASTNLPPTSTNLPPFYCVKGPGGACLGQPINPIPPGQNLPDPPEWLTSPLAAKCLPVLDFIIGDTPTEIIEKVLVDIAPKLESGNFNIYDTQYWAIILQGFGELAVDEITFKDCRDWKKLMHHYPNTTQARQ